MDFEMITARPLPTRYDANRDGQLTVSTPSCCCCCCCCLGTVAGVLTFSARQVHNESKIHDGNVLGTIIALFSFPVAVGVMIAMGNLFDTSGEYAVWLILGLGALVAIAVYAIGHLFANSTNTTKAFVVPLILVPVSAASTIAEVFAVLFTIGIGWVVIIPLFIYAAVKAADAVSPRPKPLPPMTQAPMMGFATGDQIGGPVPQATPIYPNPTHPPPGSPPGGALPPAPPPQAPPQFPSGPPSIPDDRLPPDFPRS